MVKQRIKITLANMTFKEMDLSDFRIIPEDMFSGRKDIFKVELPEGVEEIGSNAFECCTSLEEITFPKTLRDIDYEAFVNCVSLKKAMIYQKVTVDMTAFKGCKALVQ